MSFHLFPFFSIFFECRIWFFLPEIFPEKFPEIFPWANSNENVKNRFFGTHLHVPGSFILIPDASEMIRNCCDFVSLRIWTVHGLFHIQFYMTCSGSINLIYCLISFISWRIVYHVRRLIWVWLFEIGCLSTEERISALLNSDSNLSTSYQFILIGPLQNMECISAWVFSISRLFNTRFFFSIHYRKESVRFG